MPETGLRPGGCGCGCGRALEVQAEEVATSLPAGVPDSTCHQVRVFRFSVSLGFPTTAWKLLQLLHGAGGLCVRSTYVGSE